MLVRKPISSLLAITKIESQRRDSRQEAGRRKDKVVKGGQLKRARKGSGWIRGGAQILSFKLIHQPISRLLP